MTEDEKKKVDVVFARILPLLDGLRFDQRNRLAAQILSTHAHPDVIAAVCTLIAINPEELES